MSIQKNLPQGGILPIGVTSRFTNQQDLLFQIRYILEKETKYCQII